MSIWCSVGGISRLGSSRLCCGKGRLSVEKPGENCVAGNEVVDAFGLVFRKARMELNEFRGSELEEDDRDSRSSSGVVTIMVTGASGEFLKIVEVLSFRRFSVRGFWT